MTSTPLKHKKCLEKWGAVQNPIQISAHCAHKSAGLISVSGTGTNTVKMNISKFLIG